MKEARCLAVLMDKVKSKSDRVMKRIGAEDTAGLGSFTADGKLIAKLSEALVGQESEFSLYLSLNDNTACKKMYGIPKCTVEAKSRVTSLQPAVKALSEKVELVLDMQTAKETANRKNAQKDTPTKAKVGPQKAKTGVR